ncbi:carboxylesterase/lipase family protein [Amycolatopsis acididurans]|uniref:carboxylesterase/lipase family protein n=1 Tax=Amycolatopsis acididurans TaxID=2724524 RepID=UPI001B322FE6|nr:carboxylesterase family protein [Amycolatopsis acididurans]
MVVVGTQLGKVRGRDLGGVVSFEGIPYAAAPEGALRFRPPAPREPWAGVRDCTVAGTAAPQLPPTPRAPGVWRADDGLDCLNLNVWTPDPAGAGLPVMVWVHGGLWKYGSPRMPQYDGATLARSGVVVVSVGYRLGFEGFGHLPGVPANRGLHDQIAAFEWVRRNIAAFGGDPDAVTAFGQSAGAASVGYLLGTGLFRRAIAQSPPSGVHEPEAARAVTEKIAAAAGVPATLEAFETLPPEALLAVQDAPLTGRDGPTAFGPVADGELVTGPLWTAAAPDVDLVCGFTHEEFRGQGALPQGVGFDAVATAMGHDAAAYRAAYPGFDDSGLFVTLMSDVVYRIPALRLAEAHTRAGGRTWMYDFAWSSPGAGAAHGVDVPFVFGDAESGYARRFLGDPPDAGFPALSEAIRRSWTDFAATGDPGWPAFDLTHRRTRIWDAEPRVENDPLGHP